MDVLTLTMNMREKIKELWKRCFHDSEEFTELYFRLRYNEDVNIALLNGKEVIAALQMLPYPMTFGEAEIPTAYISGACTHPDFRNRGAMRELLTEAFARMLRSGNALSTLIPAEPWLFDYYARSGYAPVFRYRTCTFIIPNTPSNTFPTYILKAENTYDTATYRYLNRQLRQRPACIQHTEEDFRVILADLRLSKGTVYTLHHGTKIVALAIAYPKGENTWYIGEMVSDEPEVQSLLLQHICERLGVSSIETILPPINGDGTSQPLGMARIINAQAMLQLYAESHPEQTLDILLTDEQLGANSGYYHMEKGNCKKNAKQPQSSYLTLSIGELTEKIFAASDPYMSLMLN